MPLKYLIHELTPGGNLFHGEKNSSKEAEREIARLRSKTKTQNPFTVTPEYVSVFDQGEPVQTEAVSAEQLYRKNHGDDVKLSDQPYSVRVIYETLASSATNILRGECR